MPQLNLASRISLRNDSKTVSFSLGKDDYSGGKAQNGSINVK